MNLKDLRRCFNKLEETEDVIGNELRVTLTYRNEKGSNKRRDICLRPRNPSIHIDVTYPTGSVFGIFSAIISGGISGDPYIPPKGSKVHVIAEDDFYGVAFLMKVISSEYVDCGHSLKLVGDVIPLENNPEEFVFIKNGKREDI